MGSEIKTHALRGLFFAMVLELMLAAAILWWPSFAENVDSVKSLAAPLPMLRDMVGAIERVGVSAYVVAQHFFKGGDTLGIAAAILFAMGAVAGEAQRGTLELWLSRPVSRLRLLSERYFFGLAALAVPVFATSATIPWLLSLVDEQMDHGPLLLASLHASLFLGAVYSVTFLLSTVSSDPLRIALGMLFLTIFQFAIYLVKTVTHYSLLRVADVEVFVRIVEERRLDPRLAVPLGMVCLAAYALSLRCFSRRVP